MDDEPSTSSSNTAGTRRGVSSVREEDEITEEPEYRSSLDYSGLSSTMTASVVRSDKLTVDHKWKVEEEFAQRMNDMDGPSKAVPIAKWVFTILLGSAITVMFVATKVSFIYLSMVLNMTAPATTPGSHDPNHTSHFLIIFLVIEVPYLLLFLRAAWVGLFAKQNPWPRGSAVLCCLLVGVLEPLGIVILALKVLPQLSLSLGVLIMSTVVSLSIFVETGKTLINNARWAIKIVMIVSCLFVLAGLGIIAYIIHVQAKSSAYTRDIIHAVAGVVCLNIAWLPRFLRHMNQPAIDESTGSNINTSASIQLLDTASMPTANAASQSFQNNAINKTEQSLKREFGAAADNDASWKAAFILYGVKIVATFVCCFIFFYVDSSFVLVNFSEESREAFISAWDFSSNKISQEAWMAFGVNLVGALVCYVMAFIASQTNMQRGCLAIPFMVSLPLTILFAAVNSLCDTFIGTEAICQSESTAWYFILAATFAMTIGQTLSLGRYALRKEKILRKEEKYFWVPGYFGAIADSWLLLNTRQTIKEGRQSKTANPKTRRTRVYICTTMYREDESEMQHLLKSLAKINDAQVQGETFFEAHIIFDGGVQQKNLSEFSLILISLLEDTLKVLPAACTKIVTPYGMKLSWGLPNSQNKQEMAFNLHLKDNTLVKNKKRWSQVMYMSYVLDFLADSVSPDEEMYILTTDADVMFTPDSVEALLDLMCRDPTVGAVCARTHPMGNGPLVWYQIFEYAVGHWFQKAAEHVLGSVLCAPGCFSVYRCRALRDVLPKYCKKVESSFDFLTKDMGEDRWLCTLLVQSGWRIEYCAASENSTNCPSEFEEFYKQRRRWIASTLANLMLIVKEWEYIRLFNHRVSVVFLLYQVLLLFSTLISPSTVILVVAGGLVFAWNIDAVVGVVLQIIVCILFAMACVLTAPKTQILLAKIYTFLYAVIMCGVAVGTAEQMVRDLASNSPASHSNNSMTSTTAPDKQHISLDIPVSVTTIYFAFLISVFFVAGLLHPREITCLFHGICYLLCIPSGYLVLIIYSICNLTDSSWGTREAETTSNTVKTTSWTQLYKKIFFSIFFCIAPKPKPAKGVDAETQTFNSNIDPSLASSSPAETQRFLEVHDNSTFRQDSEECFLSSDWQRQDFQPEIWAEDVPISVDEWLPPAFRVKYADIFKRHGYDSTLFIKGLTETDLSRMGIKKKGHVQFLMAETSKLPAFEIEFKVPTNVNEWLQEIGLIQYKTNFKKNQIRTPKEMEILKRFDRKEIEKDLEITKEGHIKRLMNAIRMLRDPSESQQSIIRMRQVIDDLHVHYMNEFNIPEHEFWNRLKSKCLEPDLKAFGIDSEVKVKLVELRNNWLMVMGVANTLWLILITTLASKAELTLLGTNPIGLVFLAIFGFLFLVQFLAMLVHRLSTLSHYLARAPYTFGKPFTTSWSFKDKVTAGYDMINESDYTQARMVSVNALKKSLLRSRKMIVNSHENDQSAASERTPLLNNNEAN